MKQQLLAMALLVPLAALGGDVIQKVGKKCPTGSYASGDYCKTTSHSRNSGTKIVANASGGRCPVGWYRSGDYCKAYGKRAAQEDVIEKAGKSCPAGLYSSGGFCKSFK